MEVIEMEWVATCWAVAFVVDYRIARRRDGEEMAQF